MLVEQKRKLNRKIAYIIFAVLASFFVLVILLVAFMDHTPKNLKETTGAVAEFKQYDRKWYDGCFRSPSHFRVQLKDGTAFTTPDAVYDHIDRTLFEDLRAGEEITITHNRGRIYAIEYNGKTYLSLDTALNAMEDRDKDNHIMGLFLAGIFIVLFGLLLFFLEFTYRKKVRENR